MALHHVQSLMLPILKLYGDQIEHAPSDLMPELAAILRLSEEDLKERYASGGGKVFLHRFHFSKMNLKAAGLIETPRRGISRITASGLEFIRSNPSKLEFADLMKYPKYREFKKGTSQSETGGKTEVDLTIPPEESIADSIQSLKKQLMFDLLEQISKNTPAFFERLVVELLVKMGYGGSVPEAERALVTGKSGDEGIDGVIKEDKLGLSAVYVQAKRWKGTVGTPEIDRFVGALDDKGSKGVFITTSDFSKDAWERAKRIREPKRVVLVNGEMLAGLMIQYNLGVSIKDTYEIKKVDFDYFSEEE